MISIDHSCTCRGNPLVPQACRITKITRETHDVKTFRAETLEGTRPFLPLPGQLGMWSVPGVGEAMFSITAYGETWIESSVKLVGELTEAMHELSEGDCVGLRGPYGNGFPFEALRGRKKAGFEADDFLLVGMIALLMGKEGSEDIVLILALLLLM